MFEESLIVQSAVSAFNNAALGAPAFLWGAMLCVPLFVLVYFCGNTFLGKLGWSRQNMVERGALFSVVMTWFWLILFGGNYSVLRDETSVLPFLVASVMFLSSLFVASHTRNIPMPRWGTLTRRYKWLYVLVVALVLGGLAVSGMNAWWGPLLQICAFLFGCVLGRRARSEMPSVSGSTIIMTMCVIAILMQPEFFRFGQLGNLTVFHLLGLLVFGMFAVLAIVCGNVRPSNKIHRSAYIKLKWLLRFVALLGVALFFLTESVPVFVATVAVIGIIGAMSVWHAKVQGADMSIRLWILALIAFGVITTMPAVVAMGILSWGYMPKTNFKAEMRALL